MTPQAMEAFRQRYRADINSNYNGWLHMGSVLAVGLSVIVFALYLVEAASLLQWAVFPLTLLIVNFAEYYAHRWLGHHKTRYGKLFYSRHTGDHHSFFLEHHMPYQSVRDWRVVLFPVYLIFAFLMGLILPFGYVLIAVFSLNVAAIFTAAAISGYLFYEVMHFSYHLPDDTLAKKIFMRIPGWQWMRQTHVLHHKRDKMQHKNFNITLPVFDVLLGTIEVE